jgi:hypothetical protein
MPGGEDPGRAEGTDDETFGEGVLDPPSVWPLPEKTALPVAEDAL